LVQSPITHHTNGYPGTAKGSKDLHIWLGILHDYLEMKVWIAHNKWFPIEVLLHPREETESAVCFVIEAQICMRNPPSQATPGNQAQDEAGRDPDAL
jgi:hypothetical protein